MAQELKRIRIMLVEEDDLMIAEANELGHPDICFKIVSSVAAAANEDAWRCCDIAAVSLDMPGGLDLITKLRQQVDAPPAIALAGRGAPGHSLEHTLTIAELRGAVFSLPKPIDAVELALAAINVIGTQEKSRPAMNALVIDLERRLLY